MELFWIVMLGTLLEDEEFNAMTETEEFEKFDEGRM
jgi:hypothetical protein